MWFLRVVLLFCVHCSNQIFASAQIDANDGGDKIDPAADFSSYMEHVQKEESARQQREELLSQHEVWRQTTWAGFAVRQLQALGQHFSPFFIALSDLITSDHTATSMVLTLVIRILVVAAYILAFYAVAQIWNRLAGAREIVVHEEIIVEDEEDDDDDENDDDKKKDQ